MKKRKLLKTTMAAALVASSTVGLPQAVFASGLEEEAVVEASGEENVEAEVVVETDSELAQPSVEVATTANLEEINAEVQGVSDEEAVTEMTPSAVDPTTEIEKTSNEADEEGPVIDLDTLSIDKKVVGGGETVTVSVEATSDSGIFSATVDYIGSKTGYYWGKFEYNETTKRYESEIQMNEEIHQTEEFTIGLLTFVDGNGRTVYTNENSDLSAADFTVIGNDKEEIVDEEGPAIDLSTLSVDKKVIGGDETVTVSVKVTDDTADYMYGRIDYEYGSETAYFSYNETTGLYEAKLTTEKYQKNQEYVAKVIEFSDQVGNTTRYINSAPTDWNPGVQVDLSAADFTVSNPNADETAPMIDLNSLQVDKKTVNGGETVTMSLLAEDTQTGIASISIEYNVQGEAKYVNLEYNAVSNRYEGTITIDLYQKNTTYVAKKIRANDHNWNQIILGAKTTDLSGLDFSIVNEQQDITAPMIEANSVKLVDDTLAVKVSDADSGIASVRAVYETQYGEHVLYGSPSEEWVNGDYIYLPFYFSETAVSQTLTLKQIIAYDKQGNTTILTRENANLAVGDYTFVQAETLVSIPVAEATFYDRNGNGQREETEQSVTGEIDAIYLEANESGKIYKLDYQAGLHSFQVNGIENGVYEMNMEAMKLSESKVTTIGKIEISGTPGNQQVTVLSELGVYKDGVSVELYASNIYHDENNNGIQEANEAIYTDKTEVEQIEGSYIYEAFDHLYIVDTNGNQYQFGMPGKGGEWRNVYAFDPATNQRVNLPYGEYEIMTDLPGKVITTENRFTINETNDSDLVKILKGIGIGTQRQAVNAPVITGVDAVTMFAGAQFDALAGVSAIDVEDGTVEVRISGEVDIFRVGEQLLTYTATDRDGNTTTVTRTITVLPGLAGNTLVDQSIQVNGQTILTLPYLTSEQLEHLQAGGTLTLTEGTLSHTVEGLVIDNGEYRFTLSGSTLTIQRLQATLRTSYEIAYTPVATVNLLTGLVLSMDEIFLGTLTDVMITATGLLVANFTETTAVPDTGFGPNGDVTPELEGSQTPGLEATPETGFGPNGDVTPEVTPEAQSDTNAETTLPETGDLNQAVTLFSGLTSLVAGAFVFGRRRK